MIKKGVIYIIIYIFYNIYIYNIYCICYFRMLVVEKKNNIIVKEERGRNLFYILKGLLEKK